MTKLPLSLKLRYGSAYLGFALLTAATQFFLLYYYTDNAMINPAIAGSALLAGKLTWDALNDPVFGYLSDRTRSRFGRRRIYLLLGTVPLGLAAWMLLSLPQGLEGAAAFLAILITFLIFDTFHTMTNVPYATMTAELTYDYNERASLTAVRMNFSIIGYILGAGITTVIAGLIGSSFGLSPQASWSGMGFLFGLIAITAIMVTAITVKEPDSIVAQPSQLPPLRAILACFRNRPFVILLIVFFFASFSFTLMTALVPYFIIYQLEMKEAVPTVLLVMLLSIMLFLIPIKRISDKINKGPAYAFGLLLAAVAIFLAFFLPKGSTPIINVLAFVAGMGFSGQWVFPWSMVPDVVEYDQLMTGERREGIFFGIWQFIQKLTNALGVAVGGWSLAWFGYVPNIDQSDMALLGIRLFFCIVPSITLLIGLPMLSHYPVWRVSHAEVLEKLRLKQEQIAPAPHGGGLWSCGRL